MLFLQLAGFAEEHARNIDGKSLYIHNSTKLKIKDVTEDDDGSLLMITHPILYNFSVFSDAWADITFVMKCDISTPETRERLESMGYPEFEAKGISVLDFIKIKSIGRKLWKFLPHDCESVYKTYRRNLDLTNYDDVCKLYAHWRRKTSFYEDAELNIKHNKMIVELEKDKYLRDNEQKEKFRLLHQKLLDEMPSDEEDISDNAEINQEAGQIEE